jgi:hypothetical protein
VWAYFNYRSTNEAVCKLCGTVVPRNNNTSNLLAHLRCNHGAIYTSMEMNKKTKEKITTKVIDLSADEDSEVK